MQRSSRTVTSRAPSCIVSILTRPERRMQPVGASSILHRSRRQSFNPHPPREADATLASLAPSIATTGHGVSILTRPERRMQPFGAIASPQPAAAPPCFNPHPPREADATGAFNKLMALGQRPSAVSILTRPERRMQPMANVLGMRRAIGALRVSILTRPERRMQQSDAVPMLVASHPVSILTRPERRMQPATACMACAGSYPR